MTRTFIEGVNRTMRRTFALILILVAGCSGSVTRAIDDDEALVLRLALEAEVNSLRAEVRDGAIGLDPRIATSEALGATRPAKAVQALATHLALAALDPSDPSSCQHLARTQVCGLDKYHYVIALGSPSIERDEAGIEVFVFERSSDPDFPLTMAITRYLLRKVSGRWEVVKGETETTAS